jgi:hypothetical protein
MPSTASGRISFPKKLYITGGIGATNNGEASGRIISSRT